LSLECLFVSFNISIDRHAHAGSAPLTVVSLLHAVAQHLIGRDEHDADDEGHGESAYQALAHARLSILLFRMNCNDTKTAI